MQKNTIFSKTKQFRAMVSIGFSKNPKIQDGRDPTSWILTPKCKNGIFWKTAIYSYGVY